MAGELGSLANSIGLGSGVKSAASGTLNTVVIIFTILIVLGLLFLLWWWLRDRAQYKDIVMIKEVRQTGDNRVIFVRFFDKGKVIRNKLGEKKYRLLKIKKLIDMPPLEAFEPIPGNPKGNYLDLVRSGIDKYEAVKGKYTGAQKIFKRGVTDAFPGEFTPVIEDQDKVNTKYYSHTTDTFTPEDRNSAIDEIRKLGRKVNNPSGFEKYGMTIMMVVIIISFMVFDYYSIKAHNKTSEAQIAAINKHTDVLAQYDAYLLGTTKGTPPPALPAVPPGSATK